MSDSISRRPQNGRLQIVPLSNAFQRKQAIELCLHEIKDEIMERVKNLGDCAHCPHFLLFVCNLVENLHKIQLTPEEKSDMVIRLLAQFFPESSPEDLARARQLIAFFNDVGIISKVSATRLVSKSISGIVKKSLPL